MADEIENESSENEETVVNPLDLSDEDFLKLNPPGYEEPVVEQAEDEAQTEDNDGGETNEEEDNEDTSAEAEGKEGEGGDTAASGEKDAEGNVIPPKIEEKQEAKPEGTKEAEKPEGDVLATGSSETVDHEAFYTKIMTPFKANGKTIELKTPEEAIQLMQMGANYTRKMQAIQPHRKVLTMLESNDLLDEDKLSFLIDLEKKNPDAIKKLIKDSGIDPLEIDLETDTNYLEGNHKVSDNEVSFRSNIEDIGSTIEGKETLNAINAWDQASKEVLWGDPKLMPIIHAQREVGMYDRITEEMDRRKILGQIAPETPFLQAYKEIGDEFFTAGKFKDLIGETTSNSQKETQEDKVEKKDPVVVATRTKTPKPTVDNGDAASAASPTRSAPKPAKTMINPLAMSDEDFLAQMKGRV